MTIEFLAICKQGTITEYVKGYQLVSLKHYQYSYIHHLLVMQFLGIPIHVDFELTSPNHHCHDHNQQSTFVRNDKFLRFHKKIHYHNWHYIPKLVIDLTPL